MHFSPDPAGNGQTVQPGAAASVSLVDFDLRAARALRRSLERRVRAERRLRLRRFAVRGTVVLAGALAVALAVATVPEGASSIVRRLDPPSPAAPCPVPSELRPMFAQAARETGLPLPLLAAVAEVESQFHPDAQSGAGAIGLLQLMPRTAASLHYDPEEPSANVMAGALYLEQLVRRYGSTDLALAAYNAGPTAVDRVGAAPTAETATYVERVQGARISYRGCG